MPTVTEDFLNQHFWLALWHAIQNGLWVLLAISAVAALLTFATGGTAPRNWPQRDALEADTHHHH